MVIWVDLFSLTWEAVPTSSLKGSRLGLKVDPTITRASLGLLLGFRVQDLGYTNSFGPVPKATSSCHEG